MDKIKIELPECCLVALVGASSSGKSTFARAHFKPTEVLSSDFFRGMVCDDENSQAASDDAFDLLYFAAEKRLKNFRLTVVDATNIHPASRKPILDLAARQNVHAAAIVLDMPEDLIQQRGSQRPDRKISAKTLHNHCAAVKKSIRALKKEGFRFIYVLSSPEELGNVEIVRTKLWNDKKDEHGPFDIIGDIHGCCEELEALLSKLGYIRNENGVFFHPEGRKAAFLGDFCDRGPRNADVLRLVMDMVQNGHALAVPGNHDVKLVKALRGKQISLTHDIDRTIAEIKAKGENFSREVEIFLGGLISHYVLDDGRLVIAHAGIKQEYIGRGSARVRDFCLYGETTGETDEFGLPVRLNWAEEYRGRAEVVYGHTPSFEATALNGTHCIDTGCVFGGSLTAYRYPERECVSVPARKTYYEPIKPLAGSIDEDMGDMLTSDDFSGKLFIRTRLMSGITVREENSAAALEIMSRYAADPHWLIYLPPTMSPCETSRLDDYLEYPLQAFDYYKKRGVRNVVCEKKHMGSRAVIVLCDSAETARKRFGVADGTRGIIYTRTGRRFFDDLSVETTILDRLGSVLENSGFWKDFGTEWVCLDTELMPWSEKAQELLRRQYAPAGRAGVDGLNASIRALAATCERENLSFNVNENTSGQNVSPAALLERFTAKRDAIEKYRAAYREYCWKVDNPDDLRIAPFHILACEGRVFSDKEHVWHMENIRQYMTGKDPLFMETPYITVDTEDEAGVADGVEWWVNLTGSGGEGMVVKPATFIARQGDDLLQPAVKCRGREYLRIIYGPEYLLPEHLGRLKERSLGRKRSLALKEFSLGMESLERFVREEPLYRVHECVFGVLAFESEPVDPRL
jgi:polynucleotide kinase-phosphatase